jgi:(DL)-glycerol-3-phosphatase
MAAAVTHVIFDLDGLLVDTETQYTVATQRALDVHGRQFTAALKGRMMGMPSLAATELMLEALGLAGAVDPHAFLAERDRILETELLPHTALMPGGALWDVPM